MVLSGDGFLWPNECSHPEVTLITVIDGWNGERLTHQLLLVGVVGQRLQKYNVMHDKNFIIFSY